MSHHTLCLQESENAHTRISITDTAWKVVATHQPPPTLNQSLRRQQPVFIGGQWLQIMSTKAKGSYLPV